MKGEELKTALMKKGRVKYSDVVYELTGIIYKVRDGKIAVSCELLDKNDNCIVIAPAEKIEGVA